MKEKKNRPAPVISLKKRKKRRAKKANVVIRPLAGDAKARYAEWKEQQGKED
ncbi:MAG: hypothetical protein ABIH38_05485 [Patescibacteria group bacterium]